jgi:hypothetical protein
MLQDGPVPEENENTSQITTGTEKILQQYDNFTITTSFITPTISIH